MILKKDKWESILLDDIAEITSSKRIFYSEYVDQGIPFFRSKEIIDRYNKRESKSELFIKEERFNEIKSKFGAPEKDDILLTAVGTIGIPYLVKETDYFYFKDGNLVWFRKPNKDLIRAEFLYMLIQSSFGQEKFKSISSGTAQAALTIKGLKNIEIPLPPLEEQKQIGALFQAIETTMVHVDGQVQHLHQLKHKLLKDLFSEKQEFGNHLKGKDFETVKFEKIAINISERVEPKKTALTTYVGLEHLDAENLKIERTGTPDDVIGTKLKIYKDDIIFGKRRAYLRKVAVSHFDGIASAHSMILRANEKYIEKDFLPYFMQSDTFMSRAVQISEGSLSPTIKNKTLAVQEFILPKKEKQSELISIFQQFDTTMEQLKQQKTTLKNLKQKLLNEILG